MIQRFAGFAVLVLLLAGFWWWTRPPAPPPKVPTENLSWNEYYSRNLKTALPEAQSFVFPLFPDDAEGMHLKLSYREKQSLGEEWAPDPDHLAAVIKVRAVADGVVELADDFGSVWGKVVILLHVLPDEESLQWVESMYANLSDLDVSSGQIVRQGQILGRLGATPLGVEPFLHFEIRTQPGLELGPGESEDATGWASPSAFIREHAAPASKAGKSR